jgi:hypothetical protein
MWATRLQKQGRPSTSDESPDLTHRPCLPAHARRRRWPSPAGLSSSGQALLAAGVCPLAVGTLAAGETDDLTRTACLELVRALATHAPGAARQLAAAGLGPVLLRSALPAGPDSGGGRRRKSLARPSTPDHQPAAPCPCGLTSTINRGTKLLPTTATPLNPTYSRPPESFADNPSHARIHAVARRSRQHTKWFLPRSPAAGPPPPFQAYPGLPDPARTRRLSF